VRMDLRASILQRNVARHREHFDLLVDGYVSMSLRAPLEVRNHGTFEGANR
jgi:hypothetical protein